MNQIQITAEVITLDILYKTIMEQNKVLFFSANAYSG